MLKIQSKLGSTSFWPNTNTSVEETTKFLKLRFSAKCFSAKCSKSVQNTSTTSIKFKLNKLLSTKEMSNVSNIFYSCSLHLPVEFSFVLTKWLPLKPNVTGFWTFILKVRSLLPNIQKLNKLQYTQIFFNLNWTKNESTTPVRDSVPDTAYKTIDNWML